MVRYATCMFLASALAFPAHALTSDLRNSFEESVYDLVDPGRAAPGEEWVRPSLPRADLRAAPVAEPGEILTLPSAGSGHRQDSRKETFSASHSEFAVDRTNIEFDSLRLLLWSAVANAPQLGTPLNSMGSAEPTFVRATSVPLPPSLWMFATALAFALLFARRRVGFTGPHYEGRSKSDDAIP